MMPTKEEKIRVIKSLTAKTEEALLEGGSVEGAKEVREKGDKAVEELKGN